MNLIVSVDNQWGIGCEGDLLFYIPADLKYFKQKTIGQVVIMGHNTLKSLPKGQPLKDRVNVVLSRQPGLEIAGVTVCNSMASLWQVLASYPEKQAWVIGGSAIYNQLYQYCSQAFVTRIEAKGPADKFFPNLDQEENWRLAEASELIRHEDLAYRYLRYENEKPKIWSKALDSLDII